MPSQADLQIAIRAYDDASATLRNVGNLTRDIGSHARASAPGFVALSGAMAAGQIAASAFLGVVGGLITIFGNAASAASTFESKLSAIQAVSGATQQEMADLSAKALQLGKDTSFSASEAADGIAELAKAGVSIADIMGGAAKASLDLAAAGGVSVAEAAEIASNAMNVFSLKGADMAHVADQIAGAANASAIDVTDYKFSLAAAGAVAATVGVNFEDLTTSIAVMGQAGIKGSDAGTSLKTMLMNLGGSSKEARAQMRDLGIITKDGANAFFDASGKAKSMSEIAGILQTATAGLTEQQRLAALQTMFGTDAVRAAAIMAKAGAEGFDTMAASISKIAASDVARTRLNNLKGSIEAFKGSAETLAITVGIKLLPTFRALVERGTSLINMLIPLAEKIDLTDILERVGDAINWVGGLFAQAYSAVGSLADEFEGAEDTVGRFVNLALTLLAQELGVVATLMNDDGSSAAFHFSGAIQTAGDILGIVRDVVTDFIDDAVMPLVTWLGDTLPPVISWLTGTGWPMLLGAMRAVTGFVTGTVFPAVSALWDWLKDKLPPALSWLTNTGWPALLGAARTVASFFMGTVVPAVSSLVGWLFDRVPPAVNAVLGAFQAVAGHLTPIVQAIFGGDLQAALAGLGSAFATFATLAVGWLAAQAARIDWRAVWASAVNVATSMAQWFVRLASLLGGWIGARVAEIDWSAVWQKAQNVVAEMAQWFGSVASRFAGWIGSEIAQIDWAALWGRAQNVASSMAQWFATVTTQFAGWIGSKVAEIDWADLWSKAKNVGSSMAQWFTSVASDFAGWLGDRTAQIDWATVWSYAVNVTNHMAQWFTGLYAQIAGWVSEQLGLIDWSAVWAAIVDAPEKFADWFNEMVRTTDWAGIGGTIGAMLGATIRGVFEMLGSSSEGGDAADELSTSMAKSLGSSLVSAITKIDVIAMQTALIAFWTGVLTSAWAEATKNWKPSAPNLSGVTTAPQSGNGSTGSTVKLGQQVSTGAPSGLGTYQQMAYQAAVAAGIDPGLFLAQIEQESGFDPGAYNKGSGATGIAQIVPKWHPGVNAKDPQEALTYAANLMAGYMQQYGDPRMALAAYNAGSGNLAKYGLEGVLDPSFGGGETMTYVRNIMANAGNYGTAAVNALPASGAVPRGPVMPTIKGQMSLVGEGLSSEEALAACGPYAAMMFANSVGRYPTAQEAIALARKFGWNPSVGMSSYLSTVPMINAMMGGEGTAISQDPTNANIQAGLQNGPVAINTPNHYFVANGFDPTTGKYNVGGSGTVYSQGAEWMSLAEMEKIGGGLRQVIVLQQQSAAVWGQTQQAAENYNDVLPDTDAALADVSATLRGQMASLHSTGQANKDLVRDTLPTINQLERQGAITATTANELRSMALAMLNTGDSVQGAQPDIQVGVGVMDALGATIGVATDNLADLSDTARTDRIEPNVDVSDVDALARSAGTARSALSIVDSVTITPDVNLADLAAAEAAAQRLARELQASDDVPSVPVVTETDITDAQRSIRDMQTDLLNSDDVPTTPLIFTNGPNGIDAAVDAIGEMADDLAASDNVPAIPMVFTNDPNTGVDAADAAILDMQTDLLNSDNVPAVPLVFTNHPTAGVERAIDTVDDLGDELNNVSAPHSLTFSGNVPSAVTVSNLTGSTTNLLGLGTIQTPKVQANQVQTNATQTGLFQTGFNFNFADGGRPPVGVASLVGELGPELFIPDRAGTIVPAGATAAILAGGARRGGSAGAGGGGGGTQVVVNLTVTGNTILGEDRGVAKELARIIAPELDRRVKI